MWKRLLKTPSRAPSQAADRPVRREGAVRLAGGTGGVLLAGLLSLGCLGAWGSAQFHSRVETVLVRVSVTGPSGTPIADLGPGDFRVSVDGQPRRITYFEAPGGPMDVVLVFDASSSMKGESSEVSVEAARQFIATLAETDQAGLVSFDHRARLLLGLDSGTERVRQELGKVSSEGGTALYDAIQLGYQALASSAAHRQVLMVLSDGLEEDSATRFEQLDALAAGRNVVFSSVSWLSPESWKFYSQTGKYYKEPELEENLNPVWVLQRLSEITGGESLFPTSREQLLDELGRIADRLRASYLIGFEPDLGVSQDDFRKIEVEVSRPGNFQVEHRSGFRDPREP